MCVAYAIVEQEEEMTDSTAVDIAVADEGQESLEAHVEPDMLDQEQAFPTEEEIQEAEEQYQLKQKTVCIYG